MHFCSSEPIDLFIETRNGIMVLVKAAGAGGVSTVPGRNGYKISFQCFLGHLKEKLTAKRWSNYRKIFLESANTTAAEFGQPTNLVVGANVAGFKRILQMQWLNI